MQLSRLALCLYRRFGVPIDIGGSPFQINFRRLAATLCTQRVMPIHNRAAKELAFPPFSSA
jgi:hypothetical protein